MTDDQARETLEGIRWPDGPVCVHCGSTNVAALNGKSCRPGLKKCRDCRKQFTVTIGTIFERSHIGLGDWFFAYASMCASKKGISALQLKRELKCSYETAWFMCHRIREAMRCDSLVLTGDIEADEAYTRTGNPDKTPGPKRRGRGTDKTPILVLVERGGRAKTRVIPNVTAGNLGAEMAKFCDYTSTLHTDEFVAYIPLGKKFAAHTVVRHSAGEYVGPSGGSTNTAESYFALVKRGLYGNFHHVSTKHLQRYLDEFEFRWNYRHLDDTGKVLVALKQAEGKRLMYRQPERSSLV